VVSSWALTSLLLHPMTVPYSAEQTHCEGDSGRTVSHRRRRAFLGLVMHFFSDWRILFASYTWTGIKGPKWFALVATNRATSTSSPTNIFVTPQRAIITFWFANTPGFPATASTTCTVKCFKLTFLAQLCSCIKVELSRAEKNLALSQSQLHTSMTREAFISGSNLFHVGLVESRSLEALISLLLVGIKVNH
jgi:hypothetical protein